MAGFDTYKMVTDKIISIMEKGIIPWVRPWINLPGQYAWSRSTGKPYSYINQMLMINDDGSPAVGEYITFKQCKDLGGSVKKDEKGKRVVFFKMIPAKGNDEQESENTDDTNRKMIPFLEYYTVFNINQCDGIEQKYHYDKTEEQTPNVFSTVETAEKIANDYMGREGIKLYYAGNNAYYMPSSDTITLPDQHNFKSSEGYYATLFHEITHSTGHKKRLNRLTDKAAFGSAVYSKEELVAELGSASIMSTIGIETTIENSTAYIQSWLKVLKNDKTMIVSAASKAEKAIEMIMSAFKKPTKPEDEHDQEKQAITSVDNNYPVTDKTITDEKKKTMVTKYSEKTASVVCNRLLRGTRKDYRKNYLENYWIDNQGRCSLTDGYRFYKLNHDAPSGINVSLSIHELSDADKQYRLERLQKLDNMFENMKECATFEIPIPDMENVKEVVDDDKKTQSGKKFKIPTLYSLGENMPYVNAHYLLDILKLFPNARFYVDENEMERILKPVFVQCEDGSAILMPVKN